MRDLAGKVAVVTGGGSGIGAALARGFAAEGMDVAVADIQAEAAQQVAAEVRAIGRRAIAVGTDVSSAESVEALAGRTFEGASARSATPFRVTRGLRRVRSRTISGAASVAGRSGEGSSRRPVSSKSTARSVAPSSAPPKLSGTTRPS